MESIADERENKKELGSSRHYNEPDTMPYMANTFTFNPAKVKQDGRKGGLRERERETAGTAESRHQEGAASLKRRRPDANGGRGTRHRLALRG